MKSRRISLYCLNIYSLLLFAGGLIGYAKVGSLPSLLAGIFGALAFQVCLLGIWKKRAFGPIATTLLSAAFTLFFIYRFSIAWKFMPGGLMAILSLSALFIANATKTTSTHQS